MVPKATSHEFWKSVHAGAVQGAKEADVDIIWKGPITESDREAQINLVQDFIAQNVDGICLAPLDSQALIPVVREAAAADMPVLIFDSGLDDMTSVLSFVATDNYHGGQIAGRHLGKLLGGQGRVIVLRQAVGSQSSEQREQGCIDTLKKEFPAIEILSSNEYAGDTADKALVKAQQLLLTFGDRVDGVFTPSQHVSTGMLRALEEQQAGRQGEVHRLRSRARAGRGAAGRKNARPRAARSGPHGEPGRDFDGFSSARPESRATHRDRRDPGHAREHGRAGNQKTARAGVRDD